MKASIKRILAASVLAVAATPAFAFDPAVGGTGNSSVVIAVFDQVRQVSVLQDLGINYLDFQNSSTALDGNAGTDVTPDSGLVLNFSVDMSMFATSNQSDIRWNIWAGDGQGTTTTQNVLVTANASLGVISATNGNVVSQLGSAFYANTIGQCASQGTPTVCTGVAAPPSGVYIGDNAVWGTNQQFMPVNTSAGVGETLGFYRLNRSSPGATATATTQQYANANGVGTWALNAAGQLTWSVPGAPPPVVPLPAAVWLLLSGLGGLGVISRRRKEDDAVA